MKDSTKMIAIAGLISALAITSIAGTAFTAFAQEEGEQSGEPQMQEHCNRPAFENMQVMKEAIENGDYDAWVAIVTENGRNPQILEKINEDNFYLLGEMHQAMEDGDTEKAKEIADELGIKPPFGKRPLIKKMHEALVNGDTEKAKEIATQLGLPERQQNFKGHGQGRPVPGMKFNQNSES